MIRFWLLALLGNFIGAVILGWAIQTAHTYSPAVEATLAEIVAAKMSFRDVGGPAGWFELVLSGALANWLVGMAAFFAVMGRTIVGKYIPVFLAVTMFVSAGFQHSPANMGYFSISMAGGGGPGWAPGHPLESDTGGHRKRVGRNPAGCLAVLVPLRALPLATGASITALFDEFGQAGPPCLVTGS